MIYQKGKLFIQKIQTYKFCKQGVPIINTKNIYSKLKDISKLEKLKISDKYLNLISLLVEGDIRKAINILQTVSNTTVNEKYIYNFYTFNFIIS